MPYSFIHLNIRGHGFCQRVMSMRRQALAVIGLPLLLLASGAAWAQADFTGLYEELPFKGFLIAGLRTLPVDSVSVDSWRVQLPAEVEEQFVPRLWKRMDRDAAIGMFQERFPEGEIDCMSAQRIGPMLCKVPIGVELSFRENGSSWNPIVSTTGFIFAFGSPAGIHGVEFRKIR